MITICGIFGISYGPDGPSAEDWTPEEFMQIMYPAIVHRGPHAFGWMWYDGEDIWYQKHPGNVSEKDNLALVSMEGVDQSKIRWLVCHVRWYTHGSPENELNNHPIQHGNIVGVHNGVIRNYQSVIDEFGRDNPDTEVDSEAIFAAIDNLGHRAGLRRIDGDMVTVYANVEKPGTLHVARSDGRPLVMCRTEAGSTVFASEEKVINATKIKHSNYSPLSKYRLLRIRNGKVVERITWRKTDRLSSKFESRMGPDRSAPAWFSESLRARPRWQGSRKEATNTHVITANHIADQDKRRDTAMRLNQAARDPRSRNLQNHDRFGDFYYLDGVLMTEEQYIQAITDIENEEGA